MLIPIIKIHTHLTKLAGAKLGRKKMIARTPRIKKSKKIKSLLFRIKLVLSIRLMGEIVITMPYTITSI